ncbi:MAG: hypothetical protein AAGE61_02985 [Pseudomonadota bacterium]
MLYLWECFKSKKSAALAGIIVAALFASSAGVDAQTRYGPTGVFPGDTTNARKNPDLLAPRGGGKFHKSGVSARKARIAFKRIRGGLTRHNDAINKYAPGFLAKNKVKVVGLDENPDYIITGRLNSIPASSGAIGQYTWQVVDPKSGRKVQRFVDLVRGNRVRGFNRWYGIDLPEIKSLSQISADRLVYWLDAGAR